MPLPPNPSDFPPPLSLNAGISYIWAADIMCKQFQDEGYLYMNQFTDSNGVRYNLLMKGRGERMLSAENAQPSVEIHFPDEWAAEAGTQEVTPSESTALPEEEFPTQATVDEEEPREEFTLDA